MSRRRWAWTEDGDRTGGGRLAVLFPSVVSADKTLPRSDRSQSFDYLKTENDAASVGELWVAVDPVRFGAGGFAGVGDGLRFVPLTAIRSGPSGDGGPVGAR
ncbi:hypothetical protein CHINAEXTREME_05185 [Halobiforma lacisalsi AJ5]|uniref:Uncharacterized protein n=1 Tax=Natronobacterium lacisalsi AJ5 TaxID=358396 RepID=M0LNK6_NATLA|nr:hypothetical protein CHINAEXTREME_05185 [Halobiforma lacisalsi AJ5]EMA34034.1 hypothetical protein C445_08452 [Halobiforma lacisalsi AJ5]